MAEKRGFLREAWDLAWPFFKSEEKWTAGGLLFGVVALTLIKVAISVRFNMWYKDFYNALQNYNEPEFWRQFAIFGVIATLFILVIVYAQYLQGVLQIRWRRWLTKHFLRGWLGGRAYYRMQLFHAATDNPDQRIADDLSRFASITLALSLGLLNSVVTLASFLFILWRLSGSLAIPLGSLGVLNVPGYMVLVAIVYAVAGTLLTRWIGNPLVRLTFDQQRYEADFRFSLVRLRENAENVAFYGGEAREEAAFETRFSRVVGNWWDIIRRTKKLNWLTSGYSQVAIVFPYLVASPRYFAKLIDLGGLQQIASAFGQVQDSLSFIVNSYTEIAEYQAVVERLVGFRNRCNETTVEGGAEQAIELERAAGAGFAIEQLHLDLPDGRPLRQDIAMAASSAQPLLITGPSGCGKSTVLRAIAGLWPFGRGRIRVTDGRVLFLPQRPYLPLGTLGDALVYPRAAADLPRQCLVDALHRVGLPHLTDLLDEDGNWGQRLSVGEQQRLAFARVLLVQPEIVFLDEATSALDESAETAMYRLVREAEWHPTIVSVGHHGTLKRFHSTVIDLARGPVDQVAAG